MKNEGIKKVFGCIKAHQFQKRWQRVISCLTVLIVLCTTCVSVLPAGTLDGERSAYCGQEAHTHGEDCYEEVLTCGQEEAVIPGHIHDESCYETEKNLICGLDESEDPGHIHGEDCYDENGEVICGQTEREAYSHVHDESCYEEVSTLVCGQEEREPETVHQHTDNCYETVLSCEKEQHEHGLACYANPNADIETADGWEAAFHDIKLTGVWADDLLAIAKTQIGYTESNANYTVMEDGMTMKGYTRYGAWYGNPYGDWDGMFVSFCLNYAGIPESAVPRDEDCRKWIDKLAGDAYVSAGACQATPGDLIFFDRNGDGSADHVGIVAEYAAESGRIKTIEGGVERKVAYADYTIGDPVIQGYAVLPENPDQQKEPEEGTIEGTIEEAIEEAIEEPAEEFTEEPVEETTETISIESAPAKDGAVAVLTGSLPEGTEAVIERLPLDQTELVPLLGESRAASVKDYAAYDIKVMLNGAEWQEEEETPVSVTIRQPGVRVGENQNFAALDLSDVEEKTSSPDLMKARQPGIKAEEAQNPDEPIPQGDAEIDADYEENDGVAEVNLGEVRSHSTVLLYTFTVDFHYGDITFSIAGKSEILLSELFKELGIDKNAADVINVTFSDETLIAIEQLEGDWKLISLAPFDTEETLAIYFADGSVLEIKVTDEYMEAGENATNGGEVRGYESCVKPDINAVFYDTGGTVWNNSEPVRYDSTHQKIKYPNSFIYGQKTYDIVMNVTNCQDLSEQKDKEPYWGYCRTGANRGGVSYITIGVGTIATNGDDIGSVENYCFDWEMWLEDPTTHEKVIGLPLYGGSVYVAENERVKVFSNDNKIYTNISGNDVEFRTGDGVNEIEKGWWQVKNPGTNNLPDHYLIAPLGPDGTMKGSYLVSRQLSTRGITSGKCELSVGTGESIKITSLGIQKQLIDLTADQNERKTFTFTMEVTYDGQKWVPEVSHWTNLGQPQPEASVFTINDDSSITITITVKPGETSNTIYIPIPYGAKVTITEDVKGHDYIVSANGREGNTYEATKVDTAETITFLNKKGPILPETGGNGTTLYTMGGLLLLTGAGLLLLYSYRKRRKEDFASS